MISINPATGAITLARAVSCLFSITSKILEYLQAPKDIRYLRAETEQLEASLAAAQLLANSCTPELCHILKGLVDGCDERVQRLHHVIAESDRFGKKVKGKLGVHAKSMHWSTQKSKVARLKAQLNNGMSNLLLYLVIAQR